MAHIAAGQEFHGPDGQGYRATRDIHVGQAMVADDFEAFGGADEPVVGEPLPEWFQKAIESHTGWSL